MKLFEEVKENNFIIYAAKNYYNPTCIDAEEFYQDLKRFKYVKRLITRYVNTGTLSVNLLLNHLIVIFNVFGNDAALKMLELRIERDKWTVLKPFLIYIKAITNDKYTGIEMDHVVVEALRKI